MVRLSFYYQNRRQKLHYISGDDGIFAIYEMIDGGTNNMYYIHKDHLGSFETVTDGSGQVREKLSFDPWGRRRNPTNWTFYSTGGLPDYIFDRGYTGHEHLDNFDLINMNGRVYDPWLGRFLSPDPFMQDITNSQDYNRYSYAFNNPLKYFDPTGYIDIDDAISSLLESDNGGSWNVGDANVNFFESDDKAKEFVNDNLSQLTEGGSGDIQRNIGTIYNSNGDAVFYDKNSGEVWNPETLSFTPAENLYPGQTFYDGEGNIAEVFLPGEVEITAQAGGDGIITASNGQMFDSHGNELVNYDGPKYYTGTPPLPGFAKGIKVLQTGGRILKPSTLKALNLTKNQGKKAIESMKKANGLRNDHHGKILSNGDYLDDLGRLIDNILDYL